MVEKINQILTEAQAIRILQVQLANDVRRLVEDDKPITGWKNIGDYIAQADEHWKKLNELHKAICTHAI